MPIQQTYLFAAILYRAQEWNYRINTFENKDFIIGAVVVSQDSDEYLVAPFKDGVDEAYEAVGNKVEYTDFWNHYLLPPHQMSADELVDKYFDLINGKEHPFYVSEPFISNHISAQQVILGLQDLFNRKNYVYTASRFEDLFKDVAGN